MSEYLPVIALRGMVVFPKMMLHFDIGRDRSLEALRSAMKNHRHIFLVAQKDIATDKPVQDDLYEYGTIAKVCQVLRFPGDNTRVLVEGVARAKLKNLMQVDPYLLGEIEQCELPKVRISEIRKQALLQSTREAFSAYAEVAPKLMPEIFVDVLSKNDLGELADFITQSIPTDYTNKQVVLEELHPFRRLQAVCRILNRDANVYEVENELNEQVHEQLDKNQRDYYLREQMRAIQSELGEEEDARSEADTYIEKIKALSLQAEVAEKLTKEAERLAKMQYNSAESTVVRSYLDTCLSLPWNQYTKESTQLTRAKKVLDADHFGMVKVKERILETIAVRQLKHDVKGQILCLVGPPGVGKTSIGRSIAQALGRNFARLSLGGVRDEADIRGHRKTYIGAMPGRIMNAMIQAKSKNPVLLLDEIDKMSSDFRGDPSAAMLEVLDSEQNSAFRDHYLEVPFDLSEVLFITTANTMDTIPRPLLDRMEIIELPSYTTEEKFQIAKRHLIPRVLEKNGLSKALLKIQDAAIYQIIEGYTREAGVRTLERELGTLCRKAAKKIVQKKVTSVTVTNNNLPEFLGVMRYQTEKNEIQEPGIVNGLAWTSVGGEILEVEVNLVPGTGKVEITGNLGTVMTESVKAALTYIRSRADYYEIPNDFYKTKDIHVHFPEGATPKDGPSAGITIATALLSALLQIPAKPQVAMTGEISIRGRVLPIGGLREKTMAAYRNGIKTVFIPADNVKDLEEVDAVVREAITFVPVTHVDTVILSALRWEEQTKAPANKQMLDQHSDIPAEHNNERKRAVIRQ